ncbi:MAG: DUF2029 domain-containing protein [Deltaproteobacteria bacterium]|nr:DUF2029 domain-containing protein [Deltaproteobacteria bacterium]
MFGIKIHREISDPAVRERINCVLIIIAAFTVFNYAYNGVYRPLSTEKVDFEAYYNASLAMKHGVSIYELMNRFFEQGPEAYKGPLPYVYPPCFALFLSPLASINYRTGVLIWILLNHVLFFGGMVLLMRTISRTWSLEGWITVFFVGMNFMPLYVDYLIGQANIILFFFITLGLALHRSGRNLYAGAALAMAAIIKVIPLLIIFYMLWKRKYTVFLAAVITIFLIVGYSMLYFDPDLYVWYLKSMTSQDIFNAYNDNHSLTGFFSRLFLHSIWTKGIFDSPGAAKISIALSSLIALIVFLYRIRKRTPASEPRFLNEYAFCIVTMLLLSKLTSTPYLVMLLIPLTVIVHELFNHHVPGRVKYILCIAYGILAIWQPLPLSRFLDMGIYQTYTSGFPAMIFSLQFFALLAIWCYFAFGYVRFKQQGIQPNRSSA